LKQLHQVLTRGLQATASLWPALELAYAWVHHAAHLLANSDQLGSVEARATYHAWVTQMQEQKSKVGALSSAIDHFVKITESFAPGLFHCYDVADLPRTNNDLERCFGSVRAHERRATGRRGAIPGLVVRGPVRLIAAVVTKLHPLEAAELQPEDYQAWWQLRAQVNYRQEARRQQFRFRKDPAAYLALLETRLLQ